LQHRIKPEIGIFRFKSFVADFFSCNPEDAFGLRVIYDQEDRFLGSMKCDSALEVKRYYGSPDQRDHPEVTQFQGLLTAYDYIFHWI